jgi:hypothetical protein
MSQLPPYEFNPSHNASQASFHTYPSNQISHQHHHQQGQFSPPGYFDMSGNGNGAYPQPGYGGMMMGYTSWDGNHRPFSPVQGYNNGGGPSWYAGGFGWPMR